MWSQVDQRQNYDFSDGDEEGIDKGDDNDNVIVIRFEVIVPAKNIVATKLLLNLEKKWVILALVMVCGEEYGDEDRDKSDNHRLVRLGTVFVF